VNARATLRIAGAAAVALRFLPGCASWRPVQRVTAPEMVEQRSGVTADLRAVVAVDEQTAWASGTGGHLAR